MQQPKKYPIGIQTFKNLIEEGYVYIDKTQFVYDLVNSGKYYFLGRPRRFGKSLLLSTFEAYFKGYRDIFQNLAIYDLEKDWIKYPIIRLDLSGIYAQSRQGIENYIKALISSIADEYGVTLDPYSNSMGAMLGSLIRKLYRQTGKKVVVLIDEYDKGVVEVLDDPERLKENEEILRPFFSQIKIQEEYIKFCFITGVARFSHYTLFSGVNNIEDISLLPKYATICGITETEMTKCLSVGIDALAEVNDMTKDIALDRLRFSYDGYRFTRSNDSVYNPFSLMLCLKNQTFDNYWLSSGTSKVFVTYLSKSHFQLSDLEDLWMSKDRIESTYTPEDPLPLLFQTGYFTIKDYDNDSRLYRLGIPNGEVRQSLVQDLLPKYMGIESTRVVSLSSKLIAMLRDGNIDAFLQEIKSLIAKISYHLFEFDRTHEKGTIQYDDISSHEKTYHLVFFILCQMLGVESHCEIAVSGGRIDMVIETFKYVYILEFKVDGTPREALDQIDSHGYSITWNADGRKVIKAGVNFSSKTHTIDNWIIA